jgi:hypothetical protein
MVLTTVLAALLCAAPAMAEEASEGDPGPTIAVVSFDSDAIPTDWYWSRDGRRFTSGKGIARMVATELERQLRGREPQLVESERLHRLLIKERLHNEDDLAVATAARLARELGADLAVLGHTHVFEVLDVGLFLNGGEDLAHARVTLNAKIIDARSGAVIGRRTGRAYLARALPSWRAGDLPDADIGGSRFRHSLLGKATDRAVRALAESLRQRMRKLTRSGAWATHDGPVVVGRSRGAVTINAGAEHGIAVGDAFRIERCDRGEEPVHLGALTVEAVEARLATGRFEPVEGAPAPRAGDLAFPAQ